MPGELRVLSGRDLLRIFKQLGFEEVSQRGSHVKLRRLGPSGDRQTLNVPLHRELRPGTLRAIYRQALEYVPEKILRRHFFTS